MKSDLALVSKVGVRSSHTESAVNFLKASTAAVRVLKLKGTAPSMYCAGALDTKMQLNFCASTFSCLAVNV